MRARTAIAMIAGLAAAWVVAAQFLRVSPATVEAKPQWQAIPAQRAPISQSHNAYVFDVVAEDDAALLEVLSRAEAVAGTPGPRGEMPRVSIVLHGPEVALFNLSSYQQHKQVVDLAARLDALQLVDLKMCRAQMKAQGMQPDDVPAFVDLVDFGPAEVNRLKGQGYVES